MHSYTLMHKDVPCASVVIEDTTGKIEGYKTLDPAYVPFLGNCDLQKFSRWWEMRTVPASRELIRRVMKEAGELTPELYLAKNLALSMTDTYWLCPDNSNLTYKDVRLVSLVRHGGDIVPYHNASSYDPNASLGGNMDKYWDLSGEVPVLVKESYRYYGQQTLNEVFATELHKKQQTTIPFANYSVSRNADGGFSCRCNAFTSDKAELIPAYELINSRSTRNDVNDYNEYINIAAAHGIDRDVMQAFMDYQTMTDFIITNTDEHLLNFGVLRDPDTMQLIGPAPIFDSGNSMFYSEMLRRRPYSRTELLEQKITGFYSFEERMLANVKNADIVQTDRLLDPKAVSDFYRKADIPDKKADFIAKNYETKVSMVSEMQQGIKISLYHEKQKERQNRR